MKVFDKIRIADVVLEILSVNFVNFAEFDVSELATNLYCESETKCNCKVV